MPESSRPRETSNFSVGPAEYQIMLAKHFRVSNDFSFCKPYVKETWKVTPAMIVNASSLMKDLMQGGLRNGVIRAGILEAEAKKLLLSTPEKIQATK
eukprot:2276100-Pyramimonas_sp.AAC.1